MSMIHFPEIIKYVKANWKSGAALIQYLTITYFLNWFEIRIVEGAVSSEDLSFG